MLIVMVRRQFGKIMFLQSFNFGVDMYIMNGITTYELFPGKSMSRNNYMKEFSEKDVRYK